MLPTTAEVANNFGKRLVLSRMTAGWVNKVLPEAERLRTGDVISFKGYDLVAVVPKTGCVRFDAVETRGKSMQVVASYRSARAPVWEFREEGRRIRSVKAAYRPRPSRPTQVKDPNLGQIDAII